MPRPEVDQEAVDMIHGIAVQIGRAVSLSCIAAMAPKRTEDHAISSMDKAWIAVADKLIEFAESDN